MARSCRRQARVQDDGSDEAAQGEKAARGHPRDRNPEKPQKGRSEPSSKANTKTTSVSHSLYDLLGVPADASQKEITSAYRRRALLCHPDKIRQRQEGASGDGKNKAENISVEEATKHFQQLQAAYAVLNDPRKRERYDRTGKLHPSANAILYQA